MEKLYSVTWKRKGMFPDVWRFCTEEQLYGIMEHVTKNVIRWHDTLLFEVKVEGE